MFYYNHDLSQRLLLLWNSVLWVITRCSVQYTEFSELIFSSWRPAGLAVIALAFGRYILEPIFMPCGVPEIAVKLATAIGISKLEQIYIFIYSDCLITVCIYHLYGLVYVCHFNFEILCIPFHCSHGNVSKQHECKLDCQTPDLPHVQQAARHSHYHCSRIISALQRY